MKACGVIVEYNPFHNGHLYHIREARKVSNADCIIAVMSGPFLQRGEPAIIDKYFRAKAALQSGVDIVIELPYLFAVQNSDIFARGAITILNEVGAAYVCFGSESGNIDNFNTSYHLFKKNQSIYQKRLNEYLTHGVSFPEASRHAYQTIGLTTETDLTKPNNILGFSYVKAIYDHQFKLEPLTIKRKNNNFHDTEVTGSIASATSIRKQLLEENKLNSDIEAAIPPETIEQLYNYKNLAGMWHQWELYFPLLYYRVMTMSEEELTEILGMDEGIEHRIKRTAKKANSLYEWIELIKTKRYTWTRIQRIFVHILTNTKKQDMELLEREKAIPYLRILGFTRKGQAYLKERKKEITAEIVFNLKRDPDPLLRADEKAASAYYSVFYPEIRRQLFKQELQPPIQINKIDL